MATRSRAGRAMTCRRDNEREAGEYLNKPDGLHRPRIEVVDPARLGLELPLSTVYLREVGAPDDSSKDSLDDPRTAFTVSS